MSFDAGFANIYHAYEDNTDEEESLSEDDGEEYIKKMDELDFEEFDNWYFSKHSMYPPDGEDSQLVNAAKEGNLIRVKTILQDLPSSGPLKVSTVNGARRWTEVVEKWGYDKSWEWYGDTALIGAARRCHIDIVHLLLLHLADPTLQSCPTDDEYETAVKAAENVKNSLDREVKEIEEGSLTIRKSDVFCDPAVKVKGILTCISSYKVIINLLNAAGNYWNSAGYSSSHHSNNRKKAFNKNPNQPTDIAAIIEMIESFDLDVKVDEEVLPGLIKKYSTIQSKNKSSSTKSPYQQNLITPFQSMMSNMFYKTSYSTSSVNVIVQNLSTPCHGIGCKNTSAKNCSNACCFACCVGECSRHNTKNGNSLARRKRSLLH